VVMGDATSKDPWPNVVRLRAIEALICFRYFRVYENVLFGPANSVSGSLVRNAKLAFDIPFRVFPTTTYLSNGDTSGVIAESVSSTSAVFRGNVVDPSAWGGLQWVRFDAEL